MYTLLIQISSQNCAFWFPSSNFDFLLQLLPIPRPLQWILTKPTSPVYATTLILKKQVHSSLEAKHDLSSTSSHPPATFPLSIDQVEALFDTPVPTTTPFPSHMLYLGMSARLDSGATQCHFSSLDLSITHSSTNHSGTVDSFIDSQFALTQDFLLFSLWRLLILSLFDSSTAYQRIIIQSTTLDVKLGWTDFCSPLWLDFSCPRILVVTPT